MTVHTVSFKLDLCNVLTQATVKKMLGYRMVGQQPLDPNSAPESPNVSPQVLVSCTFRV